MPDIIEWWQERRACRDNAAYLAEEVELIDLVAHEQERERLLAEAAEGLSSGR